MPKPSFTPPTAEQRLSLNFNENSLGISPHALSALQEGLSRSNRYPDQPYEALLAALADRHGVKREQVVLGAGSSQCIYVIIEAVACRAQGQGQATQVVMPVPTFDAGIAASQARNLPVRGISLLDNLEANLVAMRAACDDFDGQSIVYLCNPNNPTGTVVSSAELKEWVLAAPQTFFLIDEAYVEYVTDPRFEAADAWVREGLPNVSVARTFSKLHGLAGLRVGYCLASPENAAMFAGHTSDLPVSVVGLLAARASLEDAEFQQRSLRLTLEARDIVVETLKNLGLRYAAPNGNFVFHELPASVGSNRDYRQRMHDLHIVVGRDFEAYERWNRVSLGTPEEMRHMTGEMLRVLGERE